MSTQGFSGPGSVCRFCTEAIPLAAIALFDAEKTPERFVFECPKCGEREIRRADDIKYLEQA
jgi:predicted RNA-binding Zn-ribbon protein involved in translation (DUF1610 family)